MKSSEETEQVKMKRIKIKKKERTY